MTPPEPIDAFRDPALYASRPEEIEVIQTHISYVFLAGEEVYKVKKPVRFSFLDFSTLEKRRHFCHEEVRLNRRLAGDVYRGVVALCHDDGGYRLGEADDPGAVEYAVHMRRLPQEHILSGLLERDAADAALLERIADRLAEFHRDAAHGPEITANGSPEAVWAILRDNFAGAERFRDVTIPTADDDAIRRWCRDFLERHDGRLRRRQKEGRIRDGHGDLHSEHVWVGEPLRIFDCIEFNEQFRWCDVASDLAFLAMDLDHHGRRDLRVRLVERYVERSGDRGLPLLIPFYSCHRAYVRGKVDSLKSDESEVDETERERARASARRHFALAYRYTWSDRRILVGIGGLSGTGKSAVARALAERTGFAHLSSDVIRKQLAGIDPGHRVRDGYDTGLYAPEHSARTYREMYARAEQVVAGGRGAIVDATLQHRENRDELRAIADRAAVPLLLIECRCPAETVRERLEQRERQGGDPSDADWEVFCRQSERYEPFDTARSDVLVLETTRPVVESVARVENVLGDLEGPRPEELHDSDAAAQRRAQGGRPEDTKT